jgi:pilus assembly protein CpaC
VSGYTIPALSTRRAQTRITLRSGQSFAISGLLDQRTTDALGRTPGIANIPILGALFRSKNINHSTNELLVIVTPELVDPVAQPQEEYKMPVSPIPLLNPQKYDDSLPPSVKKPGAAK